ncbi:MAG: cytochrome c peroxidase [Phycisphaerales bacterium]
MNRLLASTALVLTLSAAAHAQPGPPPPLPNPPVPQGNPITESKRVLGKILFWDEQFSSSGTVSCGTCHTSNAGGGDPRHAVNCGPNNVFNTIDDIFGSPGVIAADADNNFRSATNFLFASQVTARTAPSAFMGAYFNLNFWDGRAGGTFISPQTGQTVLNNGASLESQSVAPPTNNAEMAHDSRTWGEIAAKLQNARPLAFVDQVPADLAAALADNPSYPVLFQRTFGSGVINADRIALAIATYERTLVPNQTPWDSFTAGNQNALTQQQQQGLNVFVSGAAHCNACHGGNLFADNLFHNIGLRPVAEDTGRQAITGNNNDRGRFKTPSLRNVGLKTMFFHNGRTTSLEDVIRFYVQAPGAVQRFNDNLDPLVQNIAVNPQQLTQLADFLRNGLTDPRVANSTFPFDKPRLWTLRPDLQNASLGGATPPAGLSTAPSVISVDPPVIGSSDVRVGLANATAGRAAKLRISHAAPVGGSISGGEVLAPVTVSVQGAATLRMDVTLDKYTPGTPIYVQWEVASADGQSIASRSDVVRVVPFCPRGGCTVCAADLGSQGGLHAPDGALDNNDFIAFIDLFFASAPAADMGKQGGFAGSDALWDNNDFIVFINKFFAGC